MSDYRVIICCGTQPEGMPDVECDWFLEGTEPCPSGCPKCGGADLLTVSGPGIDRAAAGPIPFQEPAKIPERVRRYHPKLRELGLGIGLPVVE